MCNVAFPKLHALILLSQVQYVHCNFVLIGKWKLCLCLCVCVGGGGGGGDSVALF